MRELIFVALDVFHRDRLNASGMVDHDFSINAENAVEVFFILQRACGNIAHFKFHSYTNKCV